VLLLSRNHAYSYLNKFLVVEVTTRIRHIAEEVPLGPDEGLPSQCVANCDNLHTVTRETLTKRIGRLAPNRHFEVKRAIGHALEWHELMQT
jgi:mRNA-degrading endonuclease toxin of MazEF toxin-antitoxin module